MRADPLHKEQSMYQQNLSEKWQTTTLESCTEIKMGQSPLSEFYNEVGDGLPFFQGVADFGEKYPVPRIYCTDPRKQAESGDVLLSVRAPVGSVNIARKSSCIGRA